MKVRTTKTRPPRPRRRRVTANARRANPLRRDPTRTAGIRRRWEVEVRRRFARLKAALYRLVVDEDAFGLATPSTHPFAPFAPFVGNARFAFQTSPQQLQAFKAWLASQVDSDVMGRNDDTLWRKYVEEGFKQGASRAFADVRKPAAQAAKEKGAAFYQGGKEEFLRSAFAAPVAVEKVQLLASRTLNELEGVTDQMATAMVRTLADGLVRGQSPREIAADLSDDVGVSRGRALTITRSELSRAHAEGQLVAMEALGVEQLGVMVEWAVADDDACPLCADMQGQTYTLEEARGLIPRHPNCRCAFIPANVGEEKSTTDAAVTNARRVCAPASPAASCDCTPALLDFSRWVTGNAWSEAAREAAAEARRAHARDRPPRKVHERQQEIADHADAAARAILGRLQSGKADHNAAFAQAEKLHDTVEKATLANFGHRYAALRDRVAEKYGADALKSPEWKAVTDEFRKARDGAVETLRAHKETLDSIITDAAHAGGRLPRDAGAALSQSWQDHATQVDRWLAGSRRALGAFVARHGDRLTGNALADAVEVLLNCGGPGSGVPGPCPVPKLSEKAQRAKDNHKLVDKHIQQYAEEHNEPQFAKALGGESYPDGEPIDVGVKDAAGNLAHGVELKTMVDNANNKITMKRSAMERKAAWEQEHEADIHTVVIDDQAVFNANGPGRHDESKRVYYYRRGYGSFRVGTMQKVSSVEELKALMSAKDEALPKAAQRPKGQSRGKLAAKEE